jgi:hypothetical protein
MRLESLAVRHFHANLCSGRRGDYTAILAMAGGLGLPMAHDGVAGAYYATLIMSSVCAIIKTVEVKARAFEWRRQRQPGRRAVQLWYDVSIKD